MVVFAGDIFSGQHGSHAWERARLAHIARADQGVGNAAPSHRAKEHPVKNQIVRIHGFPCHLLHTIRA